MSILSLAIAVAYLLTVAAGTVGALLALVWLFLDTPGADKRTEHKTFRDFRRADLKRPESTYPAQVEPRSRRTKPGKSIQGRSLDKSPAC